MNRWMMLLVVLMVGCSQKAPRVERASNFPVVENFDLAHQGGKVEVDFELPNALEGEPLRPVFIGYRSGGPAGRPDARPGDWDYLDGDMPIRVRLWRIEADKRIPVVLQEQQQDLSIPSGRYWYEPHLNDRFIEHAGGSEDIEELMARGHYNMEWAYRIWDIARIIPPRPGRYHLEIESLQDHPQVAHLSFELLVSHYFEKGIK